MNLARLGNRRRRWARRLVVVVLALSVVPVFYATPANATTTTGVCTLPGTSIPCDNVIKGGVPADAEGAAVVTGGAAGELGACATTAVLCIAVGSQVAYQGTCWVLGQIFGGSCDLSKAFANGETITGLQVGIAFGGGGDAIKFGQGYNISPSITGPPVSNGEWLTSSPPGAPTVDKIIHKFCLDGAGNLSEWTRNNGTYTDSQLDITTSCPGASPWTQVSGFGSNGSTLARLTITGGTATPQPDWINDNGGVPWNMTYTQTCQGPTGVEASASRTVSFVPVAGQAAPMPSDMPSCDTIIPGSHMEKLHITGSRVGDPGRNVIIDKPTWNPGSITAYPLCTTKAPAGGCFLDLQKNGNSCFDGNTVCAAWPTYEAKMSCLWGPYSVPIAWCEDDYRAAFDTEVAPKPGPSASSTVGGGPTTSTGPSASVTPGAGGFPTTGTDPSEPDPGPGMGGASGNCLSGLWSWNPVDWVLTPVKCALKWAFVPDEGQVADLSTEVQTDLGGTRIGEWWSGIGGILPLIGGTSSSGCDGLPVSLDLGPIHKNFTLLDACSEPMATVASVSYDFTTFLVVVLGGIAALRGIAMGFGFELGFANKAATFVPNGVFNGAR